jgi:Mrp family chromosome partitioning ATPase
MTSIFKLIEEFKKPSENPLIEDVRVVFLQPTLHIDLISDIFDGLTEEARWKKIGESCTISVDIIHDMMSRLPINISPLSISEAKYKESWLGAATNSSWVNWFVNNELPVPSRNLPKTPQYIHFYGYKGGQARSTILALFGKLLADNGYRVLAIDADTEAPSLDSLLRAKADNFSQTLMGLCGWAEEFAPIPAVYTGQLGDGRIDILPCRPRNEEQDLDFALLVATAPLDTRIYERAAQKLRVELAALDKSGESYDFVLLDHRTGIATSVLPLISELPGPTVVFIRTDSNTVSIPSEMKRVVRSIFGNATDNPAVFVSFSLDSNRQSNAPLSDYEARMREAFLEELAISIENRQVDKESEEISTEELSINWVNWYLDRALLDETLPDIRDLQSSNIASLQKLREVLGLPIHKKESSKQEFIKNSQGRISVSGASDDGIFIHTPDVERLFVKTSPLTYILGRKGTGKTRLLKEVSLRKLGVPILVASEEKDFPKALGSKSPEANEWIEKSDKTDDFWWSIINFAIDNRNIPESITKAIKENRKPSELGKQLDIKNKVANAPNGFVFLIDGLETLVPAEKVTSYVASLFSIMATIQNDSIMSSKIIIRVFVREDLTVNAVQNIEQQIEGRVIRLNWSFQSIINFAISRIPFLPKIVELFPLVVGDIEKHKEDVRRSQLSEDEATALWLRIFPEKVNIRGNILTSTFLRLYFSDAGGDSTSKATFYPRLYVSFLQKLDKLIEKSESETIIPVIMERLDSRLINKAYDEASTEFINEVKQELEFSLVLENKDKKPTNGSQSITEFIAAFEGLSTPFTLDSIVSDLKNKTQFTERSIKNSLTRMKSLRIFEDRPGFAGWWRVGQLYKMGLRMKYSRGVVAVAPEPPPSMNKRRIR